MVGWVSDGAKSIHPATTVILKKFVKHFIIGFCFVFFIRVLGSLILLQNLDL